SAWSCQSEVMCDLGVSKMMPVGGIVCVEPLKKIGKLPLRGHGFVVLAVFDADANAFFRSRVGDVDQAFQGALDIRFAARFALLYGHDLGPGIFLGEVAFLLHPADELSR